LAPIALVGKTVSDSPIKPEKAAAKIPKTVSSLTDGVAAIRVASAQLGGGPGVYRMIDQNGEVLYVGKARHLKRRVSTYAQANRLPIRLQRMVALTRSLEVVATHTEAEALLLEANLVKRFKPAFNILLRDDKSFPFILLTGDHEFPRIVLHRGAKNRKGEYFGPFPSAGSVRRTITALQRAFQIRNCTESMFASRTRPCLQHQIKRCTAPCTARVGVDEYRRQIEDARAFLSGRSREVQDRFAAIMNEAAERLDFETAARYRDRIRALTAIQASQDINVEGIDDADVVALASEGGQTCIQVFFFRGGRNLGNQPYFPAHDKGEAAGAVLKAFLLQFYAGHETPKQILLSHAISESDLVAEALSLARGDRVSVLAPQRGDKRRLIDHALANAREALARRLSEKSGQAQLLERVAQIFALDAPPNRIEVYDNSHISGTHANGAMIVAGPGGFLKSAYRRFNIESAIAPGDDYGMMREVFTRRFGRALKEDPDRTQGSWPDLVLVDGGLGQLNAVLGVLTDLGIGDLPIVGVAKGPDRDAGRERFFMPEREPFQLEPNDPALYYLQRLRDEAHRFAIGGHRAKRKAAIVKSELDGVPGIGPTRKRALLQHFGSARAVSRAGLADLEAAPGVSKAVARRIFDWFRSER
jgi:excinuclease ABC subunit C